ncbi:MULTISPECIES: PLP-dependent cysteine synthase family protein [unclassified Haladaptatus]|uniref:PLP-dependent cysteine synthase family protein n=1 Tax=unclassified Haladaptatus TaxID=2622732 RepID=UPI0023E84A6C|nr:MULTISPECIES: PLP-dependent cysteine synthase family protein [unclassified Haladaptatus]
MKDSILDTVGTPLVRIRSPPGSIIATKLESFNPGGSAKDRPAISMIRAAERAGILEPDSHIVEPTSGNTGIGIALACAALGYDLTIVMPASKSKERRQLMKAYGATLELVEGEMVDARERADQLTERAGYVQLGQFENEANPEAHYRTTAEEILRDVGDRTIDAFVAAVGTGGTITGTATRLREEFPDMDVVAVEPAENAVLSTGEAGSDDYQGMGPGFVSDLLDLDLLDSVETVELADAEDECRRLARSEGILVGQSSGAAAVAARRIAERIADPQADCLAASTDGGTPDADCPLVVTVFPDSGERYLSTGLFD